MICSENRFPLFRIMRIFFTHDLFGKPVPTFPDHALATSRLAGAARTMRGSRASQSDTAILPCGPGGNAPRPQPGGPGGLEPLCDSLGGKAKPAMRVLLAQEFEIVRGEVDHQQPSARTQDAGRL